MNDHHFSYPVVVPLRGATVSGHAVQSPVPVASLLVPRLLQSPDRHVAAAAPVSPRTVASLAA
jgi:hypothetical protein